MKVHSFRHNDWVKIYDGQWSFLSSTHFNQQYTREIRFGGRPFKSQSIIFASHGRSSGWMRQKDRDILGAYLSKQITRHSKQAKSISNKLKAEAKNFLRFIAKHEGTVATQKLYDEFWRRLLKYYRLHISVKYVVDYLRPDVLEQHLPDLQSARLAAEPVLNRTEDFMIRFAKLLSRKTKYPYHLLLCLTKEELRLYFSQGTLPKKSELKKRDARAALLRDRRSPVFYTGRSVDMIERIVERGKNVFEVRGQIAFSGKARGTARLVLDPRRAKGFKRGDILVSGATRPEFLPIMEKAAAFVTDAGGILSHAAIVAREMKKPCVIGTQIATKVFKNGDRVEVDAVRGIVRKI